MPFHVSRQLKTFIAKSSYYYDKIVVVVLCLALIKRLSDMHPDWYSLENPLIQIKRCV